MATDLSLMRRVRVTIILSPNGYSCFLMILTMGSTAGKGGETHGQGGKHEGFPRPLRQTYPRTCAKSPRQKNKFGAARRGSQTAADIQRKTKFGANIRRIFSAHKFGATIRRTDSAHEFGGQKFGAHSRALRESSVASRMAVG